MKYCILQLVLLLSVICTAQKTQDKALIKKYHEALEKHNKEGDTNSALFFYERGNISLDHFDYEPAIADYDEAIQLDPSNYKYYHNRGMAKMEMGLTKEAIADFDKTLKLMPSSVYAYTKRSACKNTLGDYEGAKKDSSIAIGLDPNNAAAYHNRGISNHMLGSRDKGCFDLNKAFDLGDEKSMDSIKKYCAK